MLMPTDVSVGANGYVYVADGVNDRIVAFSADGAVVELITGVGEETLARPMAVHVDTTGRLWIVDGGNHRVVVRAANGTLDRIIEVPESVSAEPPDLTDALYVEDADVLWLVNNNGHELLRLDLATSEWRHIGRRGESLGEFYFPFELTALPRGDIAVTETINGRAQIINREGVPAGSIGSYGVELGQFFQPKGIARDDENRVWVSDGKLNVVQAFTIDGRLLDVLRDENGEPVRFEHPMGLTFDAAGYLYVVELKSNSVRKLQIHEDPAAPPVVAGPRRRDSGAGPQAKSCTVCHFEWMTPLLNGRATELAGRPR